jgi:hypothetical protein
MFYSGDLDENRFFYFKKFNIFKVSFFVRGRLKIFLYRMSLFEHKNLEANFITTMYQDPQPDFQHRKEQWFNQALIFCHIKAPGTLKKMNEKLKGRELMKKCD